MDPSTLRLPLEQLPDPLPIPVIERPFDVTIRPPGSKSLTNRALLLAALAEGESILHGALVDADDARVMIAALEQLGARVTRGGGRGDELRVMGVGGKWRVPPAGVTLNLENAGTATRFLAAAALLAAPGAGPITIDGNARMRERPIGELVDLLRQLGAEVQYSMRDGYPPIVIRRVPERAPPPDVELDVGPTQSSQFISAILMAAPFLPHVTTLRLTGEPTSRSYIEMTIGLMSQLGLRVGGRSLLLVHPGPLFRFDYTVEPDASSATYFWTAAAIVPGSSCAIPDLVEISLQGDVQFVDELQCMGATIERTADSTRVHSSHPLLDAHAPNLSLMPDTAMTLAAACCFAPGRNMLSGLRTLRVKETDRLVALATELARVGMQTSIKQVHASAPDERDDEALVLLTPDHGIDCSPTAPRVEFDTYHDHRMAMSLALIGLRRPNTFIRNPACVAKTYPTFWRDLATLYDA